MGKSRLYNRMMGWKALEKRSPETDMGAFILADLPAGIDSAPLETEALVGPMSEADVILFTLRLKHGLRPDEYAWFCRLRGTGAPVLPLLVSSGRTAGSPGSGKVEVTGDAGESVRLIARRLGTPVMTVSLNDPQLAERLSRRVLTICPDLAIPLGQHFRGVRRAAARRVILQTAMMTGIVGLEPVPMLDAPLQLAAQGGMVLRIGAIHGYPTGRGWPPELLGSTLTGVLLRLMAQQAAKWIPVAGWAMGGVIAFAGTWLLGQAAVGYFEAHRGSDWLAAIRHRQTLLQSLLSRAPSPHPPAVPLGKERNSPQVPPSSSLVDSIEKEPDISGEHAGPGSADQATPADSAQRSTIPRSRAGMVQSTLQKERLGEHVRTMLGKPPKILRGAHGALDEAEAQENSIDGRS